MGCDCRSLCRLVRLQCCIYVNESVVLSGRYECIPFRDGVDSSTWPPGWLKDFDPSSGLVTRFLEPIKIVSKGVLSENRKWYLFAL